MSVYLILLVFCPFVKKYTFITNKWTVFKAFRFPNTIFNFIRGFMYRNSFSLSVCFFNRIA